MSVNIYEYVKTLCQNVSEPIIFEMGIHQGEDTKRLRDMFPKARIVGFEPDPRNVEVIRNTGIDNVCEFYPIAIGNECGELNLYQSDSSQGWAGSSSIKAPVEHLKYFPTISFDKQVKVPISTLDTFCKKHKVDHIDFLWLDTQGAEHDILRGAKNILEKTSAIYLEYYDNQMYQDQPMLQDMLNTLGANWKMVDKWPSEILVVNKSCQP